MAGTSPATRLTYDDLVAMFPDEDNVRREIIDGELFVTSSPTPRHQRLVWRLGLSIGTHLEAHPEQGEGFASPLDVILTPHDVVEPDVLIVLGGQVGILTDKNIQGAPGIVAEVFSPSTRRRDRTAKQRLFDRVGVLEYWMVDPDRNTIAVYRRSGDGAFPLLTTLEANKAETLTTPLLPGWTLALEWLFR